MTKIIKARHVQQGRIVQKPVYTDPGLKVNQSINFSCIKIVFFNSSCFPFVQQILLFSLVWDCSNSKLKHKQYKQKTTPESY